MTTITNALDTLCTLYYDDGIDGDTFDGLVDYLVDCDCDDLDDQRCLVALAYCRGEGDKIGPYDVAVEYGDVISVGSADYRVLDENERDVAWDESLENYLDECVKGSDGPYYDRESWKHDARIDGAGQSLACYDSEENEYRTDSDNWWFLYRVN